jgi:hypothetical protein
LDREFRAKIGDFCEKFRAEIDDDDDDVIGCCSSGESTTSSLVLCALYRNKENQ